MDDDAAKRADGMAGIREKGSFEKGSGLYFKL
jgi:hypothetical protein